MAVGYSTLSAATAPSWRKIAAIYPLKTVFLAAELLMVVGSVLAGVATNVDTVIIGRVITGFGSAGGVLACVIPQYSRGSFRHQLISL